MLAISFEPLKIRLTKFAERFDETRESAPLPPVPDEALVDEVAARVVERLEAARPSHPGSDGDQIGSTTQALPGIAQRPKA